MWGLGGFLKYKTWRQEIQDHFNTDIYAETGAVNADIQVQTTDSWIEVCSFFIHIKMDVGLTEIICKYLLILSLSLVQIKRQSFIQLINFGGEYVVLQWGVFMHPGALKLLYFTLFKKKFRAIGGVHNPCSDNRAARNLPSKILRATYTSVEELI